MFLIMTSNFKKLQACNSASNLSIVSFWCESCACIVSSTAVALFRNYQTIFRLKIINKNVFDISNYRLGWLYEVDL